MPETNPYNIVVWGDSIAASGWPELVERTFNVALNTGRPIKVTNKGVGGMSAAAARSQFDQAIAPHAPDLVIIQFGLNDQRHDGSRGALPLSTVDEFEEHLTEMVRACRDEIKAKVVVLGNHKTRRLHGMPTGLTYDETRARYSEAAKRAAKNMNVRYRDMAAAFEEAGEPHTAIVSEDGVHLSPFGLQAYAAVVADEVMRVIGMSVE